MFAPRGNLPPSVYWRRRIILIGSAVLLVVLVLLTLRAVTGGSDSDGAPAAASTTPSTTPPSTRVSSSTRAPSSAAATTKKKGSSAKTSPSTTAVAPPVQCRTADLAVQAVVGKPAYQVGDKPVVELQVTNTGAKPCVQDLGDPQVVLKVYNGESRVWASHDCGIQKGTVDRTLGLNAPVRVSITWTGYTSQAKCAGTRQRVGAGTYTLYAELSGKTGKAAQFSIG